MRFRATAPTAQHLDVSISCSWVAPSWATSRALSADVDLHSKDRFHPCNLACLLGHGLTHPPPQAPETAVFESNNGRECSPSVTRMNYAEV